MTEHNPTGPQAAELNSRGLWQILEVTESDAIPRGEIRLRSTEGSIWESVNRNLEHWRGRRSLAQSQDMTRDAETAAQRVAAFNTAYGMGGTPSRVIRELTGDAELAARDPETFGRSTAPDYEQHGSVTGRFEVALPPYHQEDHVPPLTFGAVRAAAHAAGITSQMPPKHTGLTYEQLAAKVAALRAEVQAMDLALDNGADQCECGTWQVTWAPAYDRWLCSDCADTEAERDHELDDAAAERESPNATMRGYNAHYAVFDELRRFCREDAEETMRFMTDNLPQIQQAVRDVSREQFIRDYWRAGQVVVNPADHIHITGV